MNPARRPRVLLADDHLMVAQGLKSLLTPEFELVGVVEDGHALLEAAARLHPDVIVADITMPRLNGIDALVRLRQRVAGWLVISRNEAGRWTGLVIAVISMIVSFLAIGAYPWWAIMTVVMNGIVVYGLTARWEK